MPRRVRDETPAYAADAIAAAQINGSGLVAAGALFALLLTAMSLTETPIQRWDGPVREREGQTIPLAFHPVRDGSTSKHGVSLVADASGVPALPSELRCATLAESRTLRAGRG